MIVFSILDAKSSESSSSPGSPTLNLLGAWNPMSSDYKSFRNVYNVDTDNVDVAITGYGKIFKKWINLHHNKARKVFVYSI